MTDNYRLPPHNIAAEQSVIGGLMLDGGDERSQQVFAMLKPESFYSKAHGIIFDAMRSLVKRNKPIDLVTLNDDLESSGELERVGGFAYLAEISKNTPSVANIVHYAMSVRDNAMERYAIIKLAEATEMLYTRSTLTATEKLDAVSQLTTQISDHAKTGNRRGLRSFADVMDGWALDLEKRFDPEGEQRGLSTGIPSLDRMLSPKGLVKGSLFVIGARPKQGKTTLYSQMAINCAVREHKPALMFSLEMPADQILEKLVGQKSGVNPSIFYMPATDDADDTYQGDYDADFDKALKTASRLSELDLLYIDDTPGLSLAHIVAECRRVKRTRGSVGMVLVDYLTLMTAEKADRNDLAYGMITKGLKNLAKELGCVVVLLTQLNRELEKRVNKRPLPSDSRDTGQIEQDCDYWVGIHREGSYDDTVPPGETELILRLNRHGNTGTVFCLQKDGAIYDMDQQAARQERDSRQQAAHKPYAKKGGF
ncbi:helicase DnaB [Izhakiella australiensis]|uniref:DNA 5'-3' helicase n=1 Tax=Izhakiella australiensis TaxID=1926881 RepID=A0A1S8Y715_9GAMM|nr:DnaB-like helicase C-terminal domain-containing protein [Izhakiella australiensis]OON34637.1 helicase DnaB [Izhakiella australiensis]